MISILIHLENIICNAWYILQIRSGNIHTPYYYGQIEEKKE